MIPLRSTERVYTIAWITGLLIAVNVLVFLYEAALPPRALTYFIAHHGIVPDRLRIGSLFESMFLHGGWLHLIGNMWFLWVYGRNIEDVLGHSKFLVFYLACGLAAGLTQVFFTPFSRTPMVGASGAIAGVMGAYLVKFPRARIITLVPIFVFFTTLELPAPLVLVFWFLIQFFSGLGSVGEAYGGGVAWFAHVGGFVAGMLLVNAPGARRPRRYDWNY
jgi:membrane associated rhomboid family serine protease